MSVEEKSKQLMEERLRMDITDILTVMHTENGRRFLWRLLCYCGIYRDVEGSNTDILKQLGKKQVGLYLLSILTDADDEQVFTMMREAKMRDREEIDAITRAEQSDRDNNDDDGFDTIDRRGDIFI
jgi:hypothetical protein